MRTALVRMAAADPFARFVPSLTPAPAPEPDAPTMTLQEVIAPPRGVPEMETTVPEIREAPPCSLTVTLDKSSYNAGETVTGTVKIENDVAMVAKVSEPARTRPPDAPRPSPPRTKVDVHVTSRSPCLGTAPQSDDVHPPSPPIPPAARRGNHPGPRARHPPAHPRHPRAGTRPVPPPPRPITQRTPRQTSTGTQTGGSQPRRRARVARAQRPRQPR